MPNFTKYQVQLIFKTKSNCSDLTIYLFLYRNLCAVHSIVYEFAKIS